MNTAFITRGEKNIVEEGIAWLRTRVLPLPIVSPDGQAAVQPIQLMIQPIQLWSAVHPAECKDSVHAMLFNNAWDYGKNGNIKQRMAMMGLRKTMGLRKIPEWRRDAKQPSMPRDWDKHIAIIPIGVKDDDLNFINEHGVRQEGI